MPGTLDLSFGSARTLLYLRRGLCVSLLALALWFGGGGAWWPAALLGIAAGLLWTELGCLNPAGLRLRRDRRGWALQEPAAARPLAGRLRCRARFAHALWLHFESCAAPGRSGPVRRDLLVFRQSLPPRDWSLLRRQLRVAPD